jgi:glutaredoxin
MGIVRGTYQRCVLVKKILRNLLVKYEERDVFMSMEYQDEIRDRMKSDQILVPQLFVDGQHIGVSFDSLLLFLYIHTNHSRFILEGVAGASQILLRDAHVLPKLLSCGEYCR